ncbi:MAG TPA: AAA family ATPase, partial [Acidimicrobiales bacterium]|nr:AAA family ATPase [Acidimicrobiales bacterium]
MPGAAPTPKEMPLVGRTEILVQILDKLLDDSGEPASFLLAGSAGVGKSRLATEVAKAAGAADRVTAKVVATRAAASIPFGAFAPLMPDIVTPPSGLLTVLRTAGEAIVERAGAGARLLLLVDDAHLLDDGSSALLHQLVLDRACSVLATVRIPGAVPDPITTLWKDGLAERLDLEALGPEETEDLVASTLGGPLTGAARSYFYEVTQGNPLYIRELLIGAVDSGALRRNHGLWTLRRPFPAPGRLVELVAARLGDLPSGTARVIDLL